MESGIYSHGNPAEFIHVTDVAQLRELTSTEGRGGGIEQGICKPNLNRYLIRSKGKVPQWL